MKSRFYDAMRDARIAESPNRVRVHTEVNLPRDLAFQQTEIFREEVANRRFGDAAILGYEVSILGCEARF